MISPRRAMMASNLVAISAHRLRRALVGREPGTQVAAHVRQLRDRVAVGDEVAGVHGRERAGDLAAGDRLDGELLALGGFAEGEPLDPHHERLLRRLRREVLAAVGRVEQLALDLDPVALAGADLVRHAGHSPLRRVGVQKRGSGMSTTVSMPGFASFISGM